MSLKQDRQGVRKATDLEQKYNFGKSFAEVMGLAKDAQKAADEAKDATEKLDEELTSEEIFNRLTKNGTLQGIYRGEDGEIYMNASYIVTGELLADLIKGGVLKSKDGSIEIDLESGGVPVFNTGISTNGLQVRSDATGRQYLFTVQTRQTGGGLNYIDVYVNSPSGHSLMRLTEGVSTDGVTPLGLILGMNSQDATKSIRTDVGNNGASIQLLNNGVMTGALYIRSDGTSYLKADKINGGDVSNGVATLDENGRVNGLQACSPIKHIYNAELMTYTLSADDIGKPLMFHIADGTSSSCTVVIPTDLDMSIFPEGTAIEISKWNGGLTLTIECEDGVSMRSRDTNTLSSVVIDGKYGAVALLRIGDVKWQVRGDYA